MENKNEIITLSRKQLYDEIWELSVMGVAKKYDLNYSRLMATCKAENIPFPSSGYWTKKGWGKDVSGEIVELPGPADAKISLLTNNAKVKKVNKSKQDNEKSLPEKEVDQSKNESTLKWTDEVVDFLEETERQRVLEVAYNIQINKKSQLHKALVQYKKDLADYKLKLKEAQNGRYYRYNRLDNEPEFFKEMSEECMSRAISILDALFKAIEQLGGSVNSDLSVKIRNDIVWFSMAEGQNQVKHELTKEEAQALVKYNDEVKKHRWASKPQIRKYDKVYNGRLRIVFGERSYIRDNESNKLEDRLGDILIALYERSEENRIVREKREAAERKREEEARIREEKRQRRELEIQLTRELVNKAEDYRIATEIRTYIQAVMTSEKEDVTSEWIEWAKKKADWYDPTIAIEDEFLGKREHERSKEEKEKILQDSIRKSWYW